MLNVDPFRWLEMDPVLSATHVDRPQVALENFHKDCRGHTTIVLVIDFYFVPC